jgi:hypothetical protein
MSLGISFSFLAMVTSLFDSGTNRSALGTLDDNTACCGAVLLIGAGATYRSVQHTVAPSGAATCGPLDPCVPMVIVPVEGLVVVD